jgi:diguanylate cyclase (GGDEF)-like protein
MKDFEKRLYEALLVAFAKVLAKYNVFAQGYILRDVGKEIINYLNSYGLQFEETGSVEDLATLTDLFVQNGFAESLEVEPAEHGNNYIWKNLYGMAAYKELLDLAENPFLSCPLNLSLYYLADKHNKTILLHKKSFDLDNQITESEYEILDKDSGHQDGFDPLVLENVKLYELAHQREEQYRHQAYTDALTGISNRRHLLEQGVKEFQRTQRYNWPLSILMFDIDHFKRVNDTYGHDIGDVALRKVAHVCRQVVRETDFAGRYGGEEFIIILPDTPLTGATHLAERLRQTVANTSIPTEDGLFFTVTISIGVTAYDASVNSFENMVSRADAALYQAKKLGRDRVVVLESN